jgi:alkylation response protein AidB-like acyl-CoA dehydrogenase
MRRVTLRRAPLEPVAEVPERVISRATVLLCALQLGVAERALAMTAAYTSARRQFDRPIATFQAVAQRAADAHVDVEAMRLTMWRAAWLLAEGRDDEARAPVSIAKWWAAEAGHRVAYAAQHLHGGLGFDASYPLGIGYLWSRQIELTLGSPSSHLARLGAELARS